MIEAAIVLYKPVFRCMFVKDSIARNTIDHTQEMGYLLLFTAQHYKHFEYVYHEVNIIPQQRTTRAKHISTEGGARF